METTWTRKSAIQTLGQGGQRIRRSQNRVHRSFSSKSKIKITKFNVHKWKQYYKMFWFNKNKNSEGFDRIPQRILVTGMENLIYPLTQLFPQMKADLACKLNNIITMTGPNWNIPKWLLFYYIECSFILLFYVNALL